MENVVMDYLSSVEFRDAQTFSNMTVLPLFSPIENKLVYITLGEAMENGTLTIKEVNNGGSVPQLAVVNSGDIPVLLLDGEELIGAKQNRVVNTTILLKERSDTVIPVSCTEHGRWEYSSDRFHDSDVILANNIRGKKSRSVSNSLQYSRSFASDQCEVWEEIAELHNSAGIDSETGAMKDAFEQRDVELNRYLDVFCIMPEQRGIFVFIDRHIVGFDFLSSEAAYSRVHSKLVKSYAIDALVRRHKVEAIPDLAEAKAFVKSVANAKESVYESVGYGTDHRFESRMVVGSALVHNESVAHMAFFKSAVTENSEYMSSSRRRKGFRLAEE
ncbi:MAG: ARPP-1 family domain-containing protein [Armatimonadota bacterium]